MTVDDKVKECMWSISLVHEIRNFDANPEYNIDHRITRKSDSKLYEKCYGCKGFNSSCESYMPRMNKRKTIAAVLITYFRKLNVFSPSGSR